MILPLKRLFLLAVVLSLFLLAWRQRILEVSHLLGLGPWTFFLIFSFASLMVYVFKNLFLTKTTEEQLGIYLEARRGMKSSQDTLSSLKPSFKAGLVAYGETTTKRMQVLDLFLLGSTAVLVGLLSFSQKSVYSLARIPEQLIADPRKYCPDLDKEESSLKQEKPGCSLVIKGFELGYVKDLGDCEPDDVAKSVEDICTMQLRDEPDLHYSWRLVLGFFETAKELTNSTYWSDQKTILKAKASASRDLIDAQTQSVRSLPRSAHHFFTNLPRPTSFSEEFISRFLSGDSCIDDANSLDSRSIDLSNPEQPSAQLIRVLSNLLFSPRYGRGTLYCREFKVHWDSPPETCLTIADDFQGEYQRGSFSQSFSSIATRLRVKAAQSQLNAITKAIIESKTGRKKDSENVEPLTQQEPQTKALSLNCFMMDQSDEQKKSNNLDFHGHTVTINHISSLTFPSSLEKLYLTVAQLFSPSFEYNSLSSRQNLEKVEIPDREILLGQPRLFLSSIDQLEDVDVFLDADIFRGFPELGSLYPFHLHARQFIRKFRESFFKTKRRL